MPQFRKTSATVTAEQWRRLGDLKGDHPFVAGAPRLVVAYARDEVHPSLICELCKGLMANHGWLLPPLAPLDPAAAATTVNPITGAPTPVPEPKEYPVTYAKDGTTDQVVVHNQAEKEHAIKEGFTPVAVESPVTAPYRAEQPAGFGNPGMRPEFPKTYKKDGSPDRTVNNQEEQDQAVGEGFSRDITQPNEGVGQGTAPSYSDPRATTAGAPHADLGDSERSYAYAKQTTSAPYQGDAKGDAKANTRERGDLKGLVVCPNDWVVTDDTTKEVSTCKPDLFIHLYTKV